MEMKIPLRIKDNLKAHIIVSTLVRLSFLGVLIPSVFERNYLLVFISGFMLFVTLLPSMITRRYQILFPPELEITLSLFLYASFILGEMKSYYLTYWWWDIMLHSFAAFMVGLIGFLMMYAFYMTKKINMSPLLTGLFSFSFSLSIGALWEIVEFGIDYFLGFNMQKSGLIDTMTDLIVDAIGAIVVATLGFIYIKSGEAYIIKKFVERFVVLNKRLLKRIR
ncbi:MAG: hypothetical protein KKE20_04850 [Nanoarchaeota archaeon]|nr:hypothetical protein [Nanoarchaeota archaeon]